MSIPEAFAVLGLQMYNTFANLQNNFRLCRKFLAGSRAIIPSQTYFP